ncbi:VanZ family protein [Bacillus massiliigorillae]|uniref:VanZ family protein n=1 Tax=Bacillus massiliigorillae TaxID=1243664 RepID=UPI0003AAA6DE|nr:VanZ family protein [Bacillus massiliigorillae]
MKKSLGIIYWLILLFYIFLLVDTVFFSRDSLRSINMIPFHSIKEYIMVDNGFGEYRLVDMNIWGNVLMFIPIGIYILVHSKNLSLTKCILLIIGSSIFIEVMQFIFARGATDIDDVILNTLGGVFGIGIYKIFAKILKTDEKIKMAISTLSMIVGIPILLLVIILVIVN